MKNTKTKCIFILLLLPIFIMLGCSTYVKPSNDDYCKKWLPFIEDGKTTKDEVIQKINKDFVINKYTLKEGKIWIYRLRYDEGRKIFDLVLIFDDNSFLTKHSLVEFR